MRVAGQITPFWRGTGGHAGDQVGAHNGGMCPLSSIFSVTQRDVVGGFILSQLAQGRGPGLGVWRQG